MRGGDRPLHQSFTQGLALEQLADQKCGSLIGPEVVDGHDVGVGQRGDGLGFALEAGQAVGVFRDLGRQDLDGDDAVEVGVAGLVDLAHASGADDLEDLVVTQTCAGLDIHRWHSLAENVTKTRAIRPGSVT